MTPPYLPISLSLSFFLCLLYVLTISKIRFYGRRAWGKNVLSSRKIASFLSLVSVKKFEALAVTLKIVSVKKTGMAKMFFSSKRFLLFYFRTATGRRTRLAGIFVSCKNAKFEIILNYCKR